MRVLIACEFSGIVREAFARRGHDAWSCDLLPTEILGQHIQDNVLTILNDGWDLMIAHPPCTHLAVAGARWFKYKLREQEEALEFIRILLNAPISKIALENPVGVISTHVRKPDQIIQPYWFGDEAQKQTCLWLKNLPKLISTHLVDKGAMWVNKNNGKKRGAAWTMMLPPSPDRWKIRSRTFRGIADAMAEQWGNLP
jgi:site-specific DNA-cytosine methylase